jgi:hypothetical protein
MGGSDIEEGMMLRLPDFQRRALIAAVITPVPL